LLNSLRHSLSRELIALSTLQMADTFARVRLADGIQRRGKRG
jgi:hypothetical protein